jgi:hypothetical protein
MLITLVFFSLPKDAFGQNSIFNQEDCYNLVNAMNHKKKNNFQYTAETYVNDVIVPCLVNSIFDVMNRNKIPPSDMRTFELVYESATSCIMNAWPSNGNDSNPFNTNNTKLLSSLLNIFFSRLTNPDLSSKSTPQHNQSQSHNSSNKKRCTSCKPYDDKGWFFTDYDYVKRSYLNGRYIKNIGHKPCPTCQGQGTYKRNDSSGEILTCYQCHGDRWIECDKCKGEGYAD